MKTSARGPGTLRGRNGTVRRNKVLPPPEQQYLGAARAVRHLPERCRARAIKAGAGEAGVETGKGRATVPRP